MNALASAQRLLASSAFAVAACLAQHQNDFLIGSKIGGKVNVSSCLDWGGGTNANLSLALSAITNAYSSVTTPITLYFSKGQGSYLLTGTAALSDKYSLEVEPGAKIDCASGSGVRIWIDGPIKSGPHQIFSTNLFPVIWVQGQPEAFLEWWGARSVGNPNTDKTDSYFAVQKAMKSWRGIRGSDHFGLGDGVPPIDGAGPTFRILGLYGLSDMVDVPMPVTLIGRGPGYNPSGFFYVGATTTNACLSSKSLIRIVCRQSMPSYIKGLYFFGGTAGPDYMHSLLEFSTIQDCENTSRFQPTMVATLSGGAVDTVDAPWWKGRAQSTRLNMVFTGGGGADAAGYVDFDPVTGCATNFVVTAGGTGYTNAPTVTVAEGSAESANGAQHTIVEQCYFGENGDAGILSGTWTYRCVYIDIGSDNDFYTLRDCRLSKATYALHIENIQTVWTGLENVVFDVVGTAIYAPAGCSLSMDRVYFSSVTGTCIHGSTGGFDRIVARAIDGEANTFTNFYYYAGKSQAHFDLCEVGHATGLANLLKIEGAGCGVVEFSNFGMQAHYINVHDGQDTRHNTLIFNNCLSMDLMSFLPTGSIAAKNTVHFNIKDSWKSLFGAGPGGGSFSDGRPVYWKGEWTTADGAKALADYYTDSGTNAMPVSATIDVLNSGGTTNRLVFYNGLLITNIANFYP